ncbi:MAG: transcription antitermination factor NusB, partial [Lentisphaerae bacterium]|nr:transcription antitermination factor NusB [Lentisphaerota bacterium]
SFDNKKLLWEKFSSLASPGGNDNDTKLGHFWIQLEESGLYPQNRLLRKSKEFAEKLIRGSIDKKSDIDSSIETFAKKWKIDRMAIVDRNIMRIATYEMLFCPEIPPVVSINEAVEIAKSFGGEESSSFINGILNGIKDSLSRPAREAMQTK